MAGDSRSADSAERRARWSTVPVVVSVGALFFGLAWVSIALTTLSSGDGTSFGRSVAVSGLLAAALTVVVAVVWGLTRANQWRLDRKESRWLARHPGASPAFLDQLSVDPSEGEVPRCEIDGRNLEYHRSHGGGHPVAHSLEIRAEGRSLLTATSARDPQVLDAKVMRATAGILIVLHAAPIALRFVNQTDLRELLERLTPTAGLAIQASRDLAALPMPSWVALAVTAAWAGAAMVGGGGALLARDV